MSFGLPARHWGRGGNQIEGEHAHPFGSGRWNINNWDSRPIRWLKVACMRGGAAELQAKTKKNNNKAEGQVPPKVIAAREWMRKFNYFRSLLFLILVSIFFVFFEDSVLGALACVPVSPWNANAFCASAGERTTAFRDVQSMGQTQFNPPFTPQHPSCNHLRLFLPLSQSVAKCCCCLTSLASFSHKRQLRKIKLTFSGNGNWVIFSRKTLLFSTGRTSESSPPPLLLQQL